MLLMSLGLDCTGACFIHCIGRCQKNHKPLGLTCCDSDLEEWDVGEVPEGGGVDRPVGEGAGGESGEGEFPKLLASS